MEVPELNSFLAYRVPSGLLKSALTARPTFVPSHTSVISRFYSGTFDQGTRTPKQKKKKKLNEGVYRKAKQLQSQQLNSNRICRARRELRFSRGKMEKNRPWYCPHLLMPPIGQQVNHFEISFIEVL